MRPRIVDFLNQLFHTQIFNWLVPELAFIYMLSIAVCLWIFIKRVKLSGLSEYQAWGAVIAAGISGIIGVRLWYLIMNIGLVINNPAIIFELNGSTVSFGGYIFGFIAFFFYFRIKKEQPMQYADILGSCLGLGPMIGRWSCFLNGDDYGTITSLPWGVTYPPGSYPFADHVNQELINVMANASMHVHPVQIYLSINGLLLFIVCSRIWRKYTYKTGTLFNLYVLFYSFSRFFLEFFRGDYPIKYLGHFTSGQIVCFFLFLISTLFLLFLNKEIIFAKNKNRFQILVKKEIQPVTVH